MAKQRFFKKIASGNYGCESTIYAPVSAPIRPKRIKKKKVKRSSSSFGPFSLSDWMKLKEIKKMRCPPRPATKQVGNSPARKSEPPSRPGELVEEPPVEFDLNSSIEFDEESNSEKPIPQSGVPQSIY